MERQIAKQFYYELYIPHSLRDEIILEQAILCAVYK